MSETQKGCNMDKGRLWTKDFITVAVINLLLYLVFYLLTVTIASYAVDTFRTSTATAGLVSGIFIIGALIGRLGAGHIIDNAGNKRILIVGAVSFIVTSALYFAAVNVLLLVIIRLLHGIAYGITSTATGTIVAHVIPHDRRGEGIGYYSMSAILATALGPFMGIVLLRYADFTMIFIVSLILAVVSLAMSSIVAEPARRTPQDRARTATHFHISNFLEFKAIPISIIILVIGAAYSVVLVFLSLYTEQIHLEEAAGFFFLVYAVTVLLSRPFSGRLLDARGADFVVYPCLFIFAVGMFLFGRAGHGITLLSAAVLIGLGYGNFLSCSQAIAIKVVPSHRFGLATSTFFIGLDVGFGIGPYLLGSLVSFTGYRGLYLTMALMVLAAMILYYVLHRGNESCAPRAGQAC
jgi:MFS family permease